MTRKDAGDFASKRKGGEVPDARLAEAVKARSVEGEFSCAQAEELAEGVSSAMAKIGLALYCLGIRINRCQLGLFGYSPEGRVVKPAESVAPELKDAIGRALADGRLPCVAAWSIAASLGLPRMEVARACEAMKIKVKPCQLGAF